MSNSTTNKTLPTLNQNNQPYFLSRSGVPSFGENKVCDVQSDVADESTIVLSEGSSAYCDKGPVSISCHRSAEVSKPAHCYPSVSDHLKNKLFFQLDMMFGASLKARELGAMSISDTLYSKRISFHNSLQFQPTFRELAIGRSTWRETIKSALTVDSFDVLIGSTGMGKTTVIPGFILEQTRNSVYIIEPTPGLAYHVYSHYKKMGISVLFDENGEGSFPMTPTVIVGDGSSIIRRLMFSDSSFGGVGCIYFDEYHAATAAYDIVKYSLASKTSGVKVFAATATLNSDVIASRKGEDVPKTVMKYFDYQDIRRWEMGVVQEPWSPKTIRPGKWFFILPNHTSVLRYYMTFKGHNVLYLSDRFDYYKNQAVIEKFNSMKSSSPVILLSTPNFSYGYNIDCDFVVDSGFTEETVLNSVSGVHIRKRFVTMSESVQRIGRVARFGKAGIYYTWQKSDNAKHFSPQEAVDSSVRMYYVSLYAAFFEMKIRDTVDDRITSRQAGTLLDCKLVSYPVRLCVGKTGGIYRAFQGAKCLFYNSHAVDMSLEPALHYVHVDFEKRSFIYHYEDEFIMSKVSEYSKIFLSVFDPRVKRTILVPKGQVTMDDVGTVKHVVDDNDLSLKSSGGKEEKRFITRGEKQRAVRMQRSPSGRSLQDIQELPAVEEEIKDVEVTTDSSAMMEPHSQIEVKESQERHVEKKRACQEDGTSTIGPSVKRWAVADGNPSKVSESIKPKCSIDGGNGAVSVKEDPVGSTQHLSLIERTPGVVTKETGQLRGYFDYNSETLKVVGEYITLSEGVCIPFMTIYQECLGHRDIQSFGNPPRFKMMSVRQLRKQFLGIGQMYTPLLSISCDVDYLRATDRDVKVLKTWMKDPNAFVNGTSVQRYGRFDIFVKVWNSLTIRYLALIASNEEGSVDSASSKVLKALFLKSRKSREDLIVESTEILSYMMRYYINILRKLDLLLVPYKSGNTSRRSSFNTRIRSWCESAAYDWGFNSMSVLSLGWKEISGSLKEKYCKMIVTLERREELDIVSANGIYVGRNTLYTVSHYLDVDQSMEACVFENDCCLNYSAKGKPFDIMNIDGGITQGFGGVSHRVFDVVKCSVPDASVFEDTEEMALWHRPRQMYTGEFVKVLVPAYDIETCTYKIYESPVVFASVVRDIYQGICPLKCVEGMSGGVVVSCADEKPVGLVTSANDNFVEGRLMFTTFSAIIMGVSVHANDLHPSFY